MAVVNEPRFCCILELDSGFKAAQNIELDDKETANNLI